MGFVVCCNFVFFLPRSYVFVSVLLMFAIVRCQYIPSHTHTLLALYCSRARVHMFCVCVQVVVRFAPPKHAPLLLSCFCVCVLCDCFVFLFKFAQTLTIVPRVALNWYTVFLFVCWFYVSFSLTKLSMENKCGIYVLQNINKSSQVVPKIFCFCIFGFTSVGLQVCLCLCVGFFKICFLCLSKCRLSFTKY